ncbi:gastric inhibitory polypeptide receptor [Rhea pennata]|uniref:gastric inhibitory polypeptide receptor n=1 Tax=Rhea pennata TaxID=8795 RepID=UPI002E26BBB6
MGRRGAAAAAVLLPRALRGAEAERSAGDTLAAWQQYRRACELRLRHDPPAPEPVCNRSFDMYVCWGDAAPNSTATAPCPWYLPWHHQGNRGGTPVPPAPGTALQAVAGLQGGVVARRCGSDAQWVTDEWGRPWRDHAQCEDPEREQPLQRQAWLLEQFRLVYTVGYSLSLVALLVALLLLLLFRRLRCTRNYIHANLFVSFVLRAGAILARDALLRRHLPPAPAAAPPAPRDFFRLLGEQGAAGCRAAQALAQYCVGANYAWLLAEGLHLHGLLGRGAAPPQRRLAAYLLLGWGTPLLFVVPWVLVRYLYENERCWERTDRAPFWWIIRCPILLAVAVNAVLFVRILRILVAKLRAQQLRCSDYRLRLARSTLTLVPLLGVHEVAFAVVAAEPARGPLRQGRLLLQLLLSSCQGLIVSILYCFANKEVQAEVRRRWRRCRPGPPRRRHPPPCTGCPRGCTPRLYPLPLRLYPVSLWLYPKKLVTHHSGSHPWGRWGTGDTGITGGVTGGLGGVTG